MKIPISLFQFGQEVLVISRETENKNTYGWIVGINLNLAGKIEYVIAEKEDGSRRFDASEDMIVGVR